MVDNLLGDKILMSTERPYHFANLLHEVSKTSLRSLILYIVFHAYIHVYSPRAGADNPQGNFFLCQQQGLIILPTHLLQVSKQSQSLIVYMFFFYAFIHVYRLWAGADNPFGSNFLYPHKPFVTLVICCKFLLLNIYFPIKKHKEANLTLP